jgi:hypothetical protein
MRRDRTAAANRRLYAVIAVLVAVRRRGAPGAADEAVTALRLVLQLEQVLAAIECVHVF